MDNVVIAGCTSKNMVQVGQASKQASGRRRKDRHDVDRNRSVRTHVHTQMYTCSHTEVPQAQRRRHPTQSHSHSHSHSHPQEHLIVCLDTMRTMGGTATTGIVSVLLPMARTVYSFVITIAVLTVALDLQRLQAFSTAPPIRRLSDPCVSPPSLQLQRNPRAATAGQSVYSRPFQYRQEPARVSMQRTLTTTTTTTTTSRSSVVLRATANDGTNTGNGDAENPSDGDGDGDGGPLSFLRRTGPQRTGYGKDDMDDDNRLTLDDIRFDNDDGNDDNDNDNDDGVVAMSGKRNKRRKRNGSSSNDDLDEDNEDTGFFRNTFRRIVGRRKDTDNNMDEDSNVNGGGRAQARKRGKRSSAEIMEAERIRYLQARKNLRDQRRQSKREQRRFAKEQAKQEKLLEQLEQEEEKDEGTVNPIVETFESLEQTLFGWAAPPKKPVRKEGDDGKRMVELRDQVREQKRQREAAAIKQKEIEAMEQKLREQRRRETLAKAKAEAEAKKTAALRQKLQYERQQEIVSAAKATRKPSTNPSFPFGMPPKGSNSTTTGSKPPTVQGSAKNDIDGAADADADATPVRMRRNVQSVPQSLLSKARNSTGGSDTADGTDNDNASGGSSNPLGMAQRFVSGVWDKSFGRGDDTAENEEWLPVFPTSRIDPGEAVPVNVGGIDLLVLANVDGTKLYCIENSCSHLGTPLETGQIELRTEKGIKTKDPALGSRCIVCPLHQTAFDLETGQVRGEWCPYPPVLGKMVGTIRSKTPVAVFDIRTRGKNIEVRINSSLDKLWDNDGGMISGGSGAVNEKK